VKSEAGLVGNGQVSAKDAASGSVLALACTATTTALIGAGGDCDNAGLLGRQRALAGAMLAAGVKPGSVVAVAAERTPDTIAAILATLRLGAAYLPLDPHYPRERLAMMLADARPTLLLGRVELLAELGDSGVTVLPLESVVATAMGELPPVAEDADALAYVLFTSGSTGRPKGVAMRRGPLARLIDWHVAHPRLGNPARTLQFAPFGFDVSFQEIFSTLASGGTLVLPSEAERRDPYALLALLERERVERIFLPYVALQALAEAVATGGRLPRELHDVITAGEQLRITPAIRALCGALPGCVLHNHYGPTETHVVTAHELSGDPASWPELPPIGRALPHVRVRVVDSAWNDVVDDAEGELLLGGDCLAAGYIHRPELTAERFIERGGERWYRSGDCARDLGDGVLEYRGRLDEQIKLDGYRIEPVEIEIVLCRHPVVAQAVVVAMEAAAGKRLVAHVVAHDTQADETSLATRLRAHCEAALAPYLVPQAFVLHAALPLTASGKIDRRQLARSVETTLAWLEQVPLEQQLAGLWRQLLDLNELDIDANLFDHGARSLTVVRALTELRRRGYSSLTAVQIYEHPSAAKLAAWLRAAPSAEADGRAAACRAENQRTALSRFAPHDGGAR
jgi:amino acid adenylation domain-containing protein